MATERFVLLGLAQVRSAWFRDVSRWSTSALLPVEFVRTMSIEEVRVRLRSGRGYSALLIDDSITGLDRDLVDEALDGGCAVLVVASGRAVRSWVDLGASALLPTGFTHDELLQTLAQVATPIAQSTEPVPGPATNVTPTGFRGRLVAVTGAGGTGTSTMAMAVAQGLASDPRHAGLVCLADFALHGEQAMLHGSPDVVPGVTELVEAHRTGTPTVDAVRSLTWQVVERGYHLLLGLRRHRDWTSIRPRAFEAALDGLRRGFRVVVADVDPDVEGERTTGSTDVEERNLVARVTLAGADLAVVVGTPDMKGLHSMLRVTRDLLDHGVDGRRVLPIVNHAPRSPRLRAELTRSFGELLVASAGDCGTPTPIHLPSRRQLDLVLRDGARLPDGWVAPVSSAVQAVLDGMEPVDGQAPLAAEPVAVAPGSLGTWAAQGEVDEGAI
ncbi:MAG: hypothetical protein ABWZ76_01310 [Acidimicrobiales bacterium]